MDVQSYCFSLCFWSLMFGWKWMTKLKHTLVTITQRMSLKTWNKSKQTWNWAIIELLEIKRTYLLRLNKWNFQTSEGRLKNCLSNLWFQTIPRHVTDASCLGIHQASPACKAALSSASSTRLSCRISTGFCQKHPFHVKWFDIALCGQGHWCLACTSSPWRLGKAGTHENTRMYQQPSNPSIHFTHQHPTYPLDNPPTHPTPTCQLPCQAWLCAKLRHRCRSMTSVSNSLARCSMASSPNHPKPLECCSHSCVDVRQIVSLFKWLGSHFTSAPTKSHSGPLAILYQMFTHPTSGRPPPPPNAPQLHWHLARTEKEIPNDPVKKASCHTPTSSKKSANVWLGTPMQ